jgi:septal ring factor EnvC (AmiA/AmiB activator)
MKEKHVTIITNLETSLKAKESEILQLSKDLNGKEQEIEVLKSQLADLKVQKGSQGEQAG